MTIHILVSIELAADMTHVHHFLSIQHTIRYIYTMYSVPAVTHVLIHASSVTFKWCSCRHHLRPL